MKDEKDITLPEDADNLSKHAPALFALKGTGEARPDDMVGRGFVVPALYFEELSELVIAKTSIPQEGGLIVPENYFEESAELIFAKTAFPDGDGFVVPESYFEELGSIIESKTAIPEDDGLVLPDNYFEEFGTNLESHIVLDNVKQDEGLVVPHNYFENLTDRVLAETVLNKEEINNDEVPAGYFESLHEKVVARIENGNQSEGGRVIVLSQWKKYTAITAVAATVALLIALTWTFTRNSDNGDGSLQFANNNGIVPENFVKNDPKQVIDTSSSNIIIAPEIKTPQLANNPPVVKPNEAKEVIMNEDIIAHSDLMDEALVMEFVSESGMVEETNELLDPAMMEYLMNDNTNMDVFDPGNK